MNDTWYDLTHPPAEAATDLGGGVWVSCTSPWSRDGEPMVWHWCPRTEYLRTEPDRPRMADWYEPQWVAAGVGAHELVSREPLTLSPSLSMPECCALHGHIENGVWRPV